MFKKLTSIYSPSFPSTITYMLQATEYQPLPYLKWLWSTKDFSKVQYRRRLDQTEYARMVKLFISGGILLEILAGLLVILFGTISGLPAAWAFGLAIIVPYPLIWSHLAIIALEAGRIAVVEPDRKKQSAQAAEIFASHKGVKIAVAGSYGKTTTKEVLKTILSEAKKVAATEANLNVATEHAKFARRLNGKEDVLIIEYGEGAPGDVAGFARVTQPTHGFITGLAPAHLDKYKTIDAAGKDIFSLADKLKPTHIYVNSDSKETRSFIKSGYVIYGVKGAGSWTAEEILNSIDGLSFTLRNGVKTINLNSRLIGRHNIGTLSAAAILALELGLSIKQIETGVNKTAPFDHRMQPYELNGAWIIDDTYNGNIEGIKAGTELLKELKALRKTYVTPGLVDQGAETKSVHKLMAKYIAQANPDKVVLMENSVRSIIESGLIENGFTGEIKVEKDPLDFYTNLDQFFASGDLVMMQNDWPDNYR